MINYYTLITLIFSISSVLYYYVVLYFKYTNFFLLEILLFVTYSYVFLSSMKIFRNWLHPYIIFLGTFFIFNLGVVFFDLINSANFGFTEQVWYHGYQFSDFIKTKILIILIIFLLFSHLGALIAFSKYKNVSKNIFISYNIVYGRKISFLIMIVGLMFFILKIYLYAQVIFTQGYNLIYSYSLPFLIRLLDDFFYIGFIFLLMSIPQRKIAKRLITLFLLISSFFLLIGMRGAFFTQMLTIMSFYSILYGYRINIFKVILIVILIVFISQIILILRYDISQIKDINFISFLYFFSQQGISINILGYTLAFENDFIGLSQGIAHLIAPIKTFLLSILGFDLSNNINTPNLTGLLSHQLAFFFDPDDYLSGGGVGSNFIAELFSIDNIIFFILGSFFYGFFIIFIVHKLLSKKYGVIIFLLVLPRIFFAPRDNFFGFIIPLLYGFLIYYCYIILLKSIRRMLKYEN